MQSNLITRLRNPVGDPRDASFMWGAASEIEKLNLELDDTRKHIAWLKSEWYALQDRLMAVEAWKIQGETLMGAKTKKYAMFHLGYWWAKCPWN